MGGRAIAGTVTGALVAAALAGAAAGGATSHKGVKTDACQHQSGASFPGLFSDPQSVVVGPFAFSRLRDAAKVSDDNIKRHGGWKSPAVLRIKHRAVVTIDKDARPYARLAYTHDDATFRRQPHTMRFVACSKASDTLSDADGKPVTFWSGFFVVNKAPACVGIKIKVDRRPARHYTIAIGRAACEG
jgi:hypothetical protein